MSTGVCFQYARNGTCSYGTRCKFPHVLNAPVPARGLGNGTRDKKRSQATQSRVVDVSSSTPLEDFFAQYPSYDYDSSNSASHEFYDLCDWMQWEENDAVRRNAHNAFKDALVMQFNQIYGTDENDIAAWRDLCQVVGISPIPDDLESCRQKVKNTHVNIVDLVDTKGSGEMVESFRSEMKLSEYTKAEGKFFPRENAYAGGLLKFLLRQIMSPPPEHSSSRHRANRRR